MDIDAHGKEGKGQSIIGRDDAWRNIDYSKAGIKATPNAVKKAELN